ncbi:DUF2752 domain-containing protein [Synechococcus sp. CS-1325]|nr:DUF2752 domain-containing protein [Synechococcus sp. CS-1325]MCT0214167.1 DUF2752 domain-containing protein [Synechococcus sp. CS-1326]MCT0232497.1 DUF2752 domain-containing protein [Synechococcus sp. CS-1327]PZU99216.1 MAG: DUF2752 domain-containing protein [Cyanobium sp.]
MAPALLTGYLGLKAFHPLLPGFSCPFRAISGIPCPTCFLTRSIAASLRGDLAESLSLHALGPIAAVGLIVWSAQAIHTRRLVPRGLKTWHGVLAAAVLLAYWLARLVLTYGLGLNAFATG